MNTMQFAWRVGVLQPVRAKENSPPIHRWARRQGQASPGRDERHARGRLRLSSVPGGTRPGGDCQPSVETLGYSRTSLRDGSTGRVNAQHFPARAQRVESARGLAQSRARLRRLGRGWSRQRLGVRRPSVALAPRLSTRRRSADFQSAVSRISNPQPLEDSTLWPNATRSRQEAGDTADWKSALQAATIAQRSLAAQPKARRGEPLALVEGRE